MTESEKLNNSQSEKKINLQCENSLHVDGITVHSRNQTSNIKLSNDQNKDTLIEDQNNLKLSNYQTKDNIQLNGDINDDLLDIILNPHVHTIDATLKDLETSTDKQHKNSLIEELMLVFLKDDILFCKNIQDRFPKIINLLRDDDIYFSTCILISDIVRHKPVIQNIFFKLGVFSLLNFENYKPTINLVFGMCYENKEILEYFKNNIYVKERDEGNELICILMS